MKDILQALHGANLIGLANTLRAIQYAWQRDRLEARFLPQREGKTARSPGKLQDAHALTSGARFEFKRTHLEVRFLTPDFLFLAWDGAAQTPSYAVHNTGWAAVNCRLQPNGDEWLLQTERLSLSIHPDGGLTLRNASGETIRQDEPPIFLDQGWRGRSPLPAEAAIYGLGERAARLNLRPGKYTFWNTEVGGSYGPGADPLYICMPVYLCLGDQTSLLVFYDNTFKGALTLDAKATIEFTGGPARYYLGAGQPAQLLARFTQLTGRAPLPPRWALGYQQSRWGYRTEAEMRRVFQGFRQHELPLSVLYLDADHMRGYRTLTVDEARYPNLAEFAAELHQEGVHLVASVNPAVKIEYGLDLFDAGLAQDAFCKTPTGRLAQGVVWPGWCALTDFTNPQVRAWWGAQYRRLLDYGLDGFWHDMNEPSSFAAWGEQTFPLVAQHDLDGQPGDHREAHNVYGLLMNRAAYEGLLSLQPDKRPFILSRSGWVGMQRYSWCWTGDVETSWEALRQTIACVLGLGLSGLPYAGPDIGGFTGEPSTEMFIRWFQLGAFLPFFRTHCAFYLPRREPWEFGAQALEILRAVLRLRYRLLPYWYTLAWQASQSGAPLVRPLFWSDPQNRDLWEIDDAFLLGADLLVAPILEPGARQRTLTLPPGDWYDFYTGQRFTGGAEITVAAPLERIPLLARAGAILPLSTGDSLKIHIYRPTPGAEGHGRLYSDAGDGFGEHRLEEWGLLPLDGGGYELRWLSSGDYAWPYRNTIIHPHGMDPAEIRVNVAGIDWQWA